MKCIINLETCEDPRDIFELKMNALLTFVVIGLVSLQCIDGWERPSFKQNSIWNYVTDRTSRAYKYAKEKMEGLKTFIYEKKGKVSNYTDEKVTNLKEKFISHINLATATAGTVYDSIVQATRGNYNCSDSYLGNHMTTPQLIAFHGYKAESHTITTEDGYILTVHRIPNIRSEVSSRKTVLLHHGLLGSSAEWVIPGPGKGLAYTLSDAGYDVWMANARGNTYSKAHIFHKIVSNEFWNFTFHEIGYYDLPAVIDYIVQRKTEDVELNYIGFSMGTTVLFTLLSTRPEYNKVLRAGVAMAPVAYMSGVKGPLNVLADYGNNIEKFMKLFGVNEFLPRGDVVRFLSKHSCAVSKFEDVVCEMTLYTLCGHDKDQFDLSLRPMIFGHLPAGASTKTLAHYAQEIRNEGRFQQFDYGFDGNMKRYGDKAPPAYPIEKITLPIALLSGDNDWLSSVNDAKNLYQHLINPIERTIIHDFNHLDFLFGKKAPEKVYKNILDLLRITNDNISFKNKNISSNSY